MASTRTPSRNSGHPKPSLGRSEAGGIRPFLGKGGAEYREGPGTGPVLRVDRRRAPDSRMIPAWAARSDVHR
jgi:hypothetical protein